MSNEVSIQVSIEKNFYQKLLINAIIWSMLEYISTPDYDETENGVSKSTVLQLTIKHLTKEKSLGS